MPIGERQYISSIWDEIKAEVDNGGEFGIHILMDGAAGKESNLYNSFGSRHIGTGALFSVNRLSGFLEEILEPPFPLISDIRVPVFVK